MAGFRKYTHPKVGGGKGRSSGYRTAGPGKGTQAGLPPKAPNPFKRAKMTVNRAAGTAKMPKGGIY
jgi:hypothetical protein